MTTTMTPHIGTKLVNACPMTLGDYNKLQGWLIPEGQNPADDGYLVEYADGGKPNHPDYAGYISWSPKGVFERAYQPVEGLTFDIGKASVLLRQGHRVQRVGRAGHLRLEGDFIQHIVDDMTVPYGFDQADVLSDDWQIARA